MPEETSERFERLEREVRRLRRTARAQAAGLGALLALLSIGAATEPQELTLRTLTIVDAEGHPRVVATGTDAVSDAAAAGLRAIDRNGKTRIALWTATDGAAALAINDRDGERRWTQVSP